MKLEKISAKLSPKVVVLIYLTLPFRFGMLASSSSASEISQKPAQAFMRGEKELEKMLADRPQMSEYLQPKDILWTWTANQFAGKDTGVPLCWDSTSPLNAAESDYTLGAIRISPVDRRQLKPARGDQLWMEAVNELLNIRNGHEYEILWEKALAGELGRAEWAKRNCELEFEALKQTKQFYFEVWVKQISKLDRPSNPEDWRINLPNSFDLWYQTVDGKELSGYWLSKFPTLPDSICAKALLAERLGNGETALARYKEYLDLVGDDGTYSKMAKLSVQRLSRDVKGTIHDVRLSQKQAARECYEEGIVAFQHGNENLALVKFNAAIDLDRNEYTYFFARGSVFDRLGDFEKAKLDYEVASLDLSLQDKCTLALSNLAKRKILPLLKDAYEKLSGGTKKDLLTAVKEYEEAVQLDDAAETRFDLGLTFEKLGKTADALDNYLKALKLNPDLAVAYPAIGMTYEKIGKMSLAKEYYHRCLDLQPSSAAAKSCQQRLKVLGAD